MHFLDVEQYVSCKVIVECSAYTMVGPIQNKAIKCRNFFVLSIPVQCSTYKGTE